MRADIIHPIVLDFIETLKTQRKWCEGTTTRNRSRINNLLKYCKKDPTQITREDIMRFFNEKKSKEYWTNSHTMVLSYHMIKLFLMYLYVRGYIPEPIDIKIKATKELPQEVDRDFFLAIRKQKRVADRYSISMRDRVLWYLLYFSTATMNDIPNILVKNLKLDNNCIYLDNVKDGKTNYIFLHNECVRMIRLYMGKRLYNSPYLIPKRNNNQEPLESHYIGTIIRNIAKKSGVTINQWQRKNFQIYIAIQKKADIHTLRYMFGVKNIKKFQSFMDNNNAKIRPFKEMRKINRVLHRFV